MSAHGTYGGYSAGCRCEGCAEAMRAYKRARRAEGLAPGDWRHGSTGGYSNHGCRCERCTSVWAAAQLEGNRKRARKLTGDDPRHGSYSTYTNYACRCDKCRAAHTAEKRRVRAESRGVA